MKAVAVNSSFEITTHDIWAHGGKGDSNLINFNKENLVTVNLELMAIEENGKLFEIIKPKKWYKASYEDDINDNREKRDNNE